MKLVQTDMFATTLADTPLFSGTPIRVQLSEFRPRTITRQQSILPAPSWSELRTNHAPKPGRRYRR